MKKISVWLLFALVFVCFSSCAHSPKYMNTNRNFYGSTLPDRLGGFIVGGHQGNIFGLKFNTIEGFEEAAFFGADVVEMDLRTSKDGVAVVFHDEKMDLWSDCSGNLREKELKEIEMCRHRPSGNKIPTFEDVVLWSSGNFIINAEFKDKEAIASALATVKRCWAYEWVYFQATSWEKYELVRSIDKDVYLLFPIHSEADLNKALSIKDERLLVIEVNEKTRTAENIKRIHDAGKLVSEDSWHFSASYELFGATCTELFLNGIDIAITNRPEGCVEQKDNLLKEKKRP